MISGIDYGKGSDQSATITFISPEYLKHLQQENQQLKLELSGYRQAILEDKDMLGLKEENQQLKDRIDKAIEYIENNSLYEKEYDYDYDDNLELSNISDSEAKEELLNILRGNNE